MPKPSRFPVSFFILVAVAALALSGAKPPASSGAAYTHEQVVWASYWTVEPGFTSTLEMKNNRINEWLTVHPSLYFASGEEYPLNPIQMGPRQTVVVSLNRVMAELPRQVAARAGTEGSLELEYDASSASALMGSVSVTNPQKGIAWNFFMYPTNANAPIVPVAGVFLLPNRDANGFVIVHNASEEAMTVNPRLWVGGQSYVLDTLYLNGGQGYKLELRPELRRLGLNETTAGGLEFSYQGAPDALKAHGVLFDNRGFSAEVDFNRIDSVSDPRSFALRTPRFAIGAADPALGLARRTVFEPVVALHNFNAEALTTKLSVGYKNEAGPQELQIPVVLAPGDTRVLRLHPYLGEVVPANQPWASLEVSYVASRNGLAAMMVSTSRDGDHSIRSVLNWVERSSREGWYWRADADHNTLLGIYNPDSEPARLAVWLDYYDGGSRRTYEFPEMSVPPRSSELLDIGAIIARQIPDANAQTIPHAVSFGGYRVRKIERLGVNITTEALVFDRRTKSFLTFYNTGCCHGFGAQLCAGSIDTCPTGLGGIPGTYGYWLHVKVWDNCTGAYLDIVEDSGINFSSDNGDVAYAGAFGYVQLVGPGSTTLRANIFHYRDSGDGDCQNFPPELGACGVTVQPSVAVTTADIVGDSIVVNLSPPSASGTLVIMVQGQGVSHTAFNGTRSGGTHTFTFDRPNLPVGQYSSVLATWTVNGIAGTGSRTVGFYVMGTVRHSQYNTPAESACSGPPANAYITNPNCNFSATNLRSDFISQSWLNGSGITINYGTEQNEAFCLSHQNAPADASGRSFRPQAIEVTCGPSYTVSNTTVARGDDAPLVCGDSVLIIGLGGSAVTKTVTDRCPRCTGHLQLDNYTTQTDCQPGAIPDLGNFKTIRLR